VFLKTDASQSMVSEVGILFVSCQSVSDTVWTCGWICWNIHASSVDWERQNLAIVCQDLQQHFRNPQFTVWPFFFFFWNSICHCRGRKFDVTIMIQEQLRDFTFLNSKDRTFACASGSDIMAGLTITREQLW